MLNYLSYRTMMDMLKLVQIEQAKLVDKKGYCTEIRAGKYGYSDDCITFDFRIYKGEELVKQFEFSAVYDSKSLIESYRALVAYIKTL